MSINVNKIGYVDLMDGVTRIQTEQPYSSVLRNGSIIMAFIEQVEGKTLNLRTGDGMLLKALAQEDIGFAQGDVIEAAVERNDGRCRLYLLNVSRAGVSAEAADTEPKSSPALLSEMLSTLKRNPGMDADMALFLTENHIPDTAENVQALTQMVREEGIGALIKQILASIAPTNEPSERMVAADSGELIPQQAYAQYEAASPGTAGMQRQGADAQRQVTDAQRFEEENNIMGVGSRIPDATTLVVSKGEPEVASGGHPADLAPLTGDIAREIGTMEPNRLESGAVPVLEQGEVKPGEIASGFEIHASVAFEVDTQAVIKTQADVNTVPEHIARLARNTTVLPELQTGAEIKKIIHDMPRAMRALKSLLFQSDIKDNEVCLKAVDRTLKQMELADHTIRFEHAQFPLMDRMGEYRTAELYVFRNRKGRKGLDEAGISILLALSGCNIGRTETLIRQTGGNVSLEFRLENENAPDIFKTHSAMLSAAVEAEGYKLLEMRFTGLERRTTILSAGGVEGLAAGDTANAVDMLI